jgi:NTE family protein
LSRLFKNIAFGGCGVRNAGYAGALLALGERDLFRHVGAVAGTSAGSIVAALVAVGYTPEEVRQRILELDFTRITDGNLFTGPIALLRSFGWHAAKYLEQTLGELIAVKTGNPKSTFEDLERGNFMQLRIVGTNLTTRRVRVFPDAESRQMTVTSAVRISMAIPLFFEARRVAGDVYVDGGVLWNVPVEAFDTPIAANPETLGLMIKERASEPAPVRSLHDFAEALFRTILRGQEADTEARPASQGRVVAIDDLGISATNFAVTREQKQALVDEGFRATNRFLDTL